VLGAPLPDGERASARMHRIGMAGVSKGWPDRCDRYGVDLEQALRDADDEERASEHLVDPHRGKSSPGWIRLQCSRSPLSHVNSRRSARTS